MWGAVGGLGLARVYAVLPHSSSHIFGWVSWTENAGISGQT